MHRQPASVRFDLEAGVFEVDRYGKGGDTLEPTRALRDVFAKGYEVHYQEFVGGHDGLSWRGTLADGLIALLGTSPNPEVSSTCCGDRNFHGFTDFGKRRSRHTDEGPNRFIISGVWSARRPGSAP